MATLSGLPKPVAPESMHPVSVAGVELASMVHARTSPEPSSATNAVDPVMAIPYGPFKPVAPVVVHPVSVSGNELVSMVHAMTSALL